MVAVQAACGEAASKLARRGPEIFSILIDQYIAMTIIDHVEFAVRDAEASRRFYEHALAPIGFTRILSLGPERTRTGGTRHGFGKDGYPSFWIHDNEPAAAGTHIAFATQDRAVVDAFHRAALQAGGTDNGAPGVRPHYHAHYYAAYVLDPDGTNVEVVCQHSS